MTRLKHLLRENLIHNWRLDLKQKHSIGLTIGLKKDCKKIDHQNSNLIN